jgi:flagellar operon protein
MKVNELQINQNFDSFKPDQVKGPGQSGHKSNQLDKLGKEDSKSFKDILNTKLDENSSLKFSAHAARRIQEREMDITPTQLSRLENGVGKAQEKGAKNSLVLVDKDAYIVSVKNKTVVTAMPQASTTGNVFTNIDSVTII